MLQTLPDHSDKRQGDPHSAKTIDVGAAWSDIWRRPGLVITAVTCAMIGAGFYIAVAPTIYRATTLVSIDPKVDSAFHRQTVVSDANADSALVESEAEILRSPQIARAVVERETLTGESVLSGGGGARRNLAAMLDSLNRMLGGVEGSTLGRLAALVQPPVSSSEVERVSEQLQRRVDVKRVGATYVIAVTADLPDPQLAARIANAYSQAFIAARLDAQRENARRSSDLLNERASELQRQAVSAELAVEEMRLGGGPDAASAASAKVNLRNLESTARTYRALYDRFLQSYAEASQSGLVVLPRASIVSAATPPLAKYWPNVTLVLAAALVIGFSGGALLALLRR